MEETWRAAITNSLNKFIEKVITFLPNMLALITILLVGFIIAWIVKKLVMRFLKAIQFDRLSERWGLAQVLLKGGGAGPPSHLLARFLYWVIVVTTLILGINSLEVAVTRNLVTQFFNYIPNLFVAVIILVIGYFVAIFLSQAALIAAVNAQMESARLLGRSVRWFIIILSLTMALFHLGVAEKVVLAAFTIALGGIVLALAIAFGWGGKELAKDFLERLCERKKRKDEESDRISHV
jgi:hypothetical protein